MILGVIYLTTGTISGCFCILLAKVMDRLFLGGKNSNLTDLITDTIKKQG